YPRGDTGSSWQRRSPDTNWNTPGGDYDPQPTDCIDLVVDGTGQFITFDVTADAAQAQFGYILIAPDTPYRRDRLTSNQGANAERRPALVINYTTGGNGPFDNDNDGFTDDVDCDDDDPAVNPGAEEIFDDGVDNDCNPETPDQPPVRNLVVEGEIDNTIRRESEVNMGLDALLYLSYTEVGGYRPLIQFSSWRLPADTRIDSVNLRLFYERTQYGEGTRLVCAHRVLNSWEEGAATHYWDYARGDTGSSWLRRSPEVNWNIPGGDFVAQPTDCIELDTGDIDGFVSFDVTADIAQAQFGYIIVAQDTLYRKDRFTSIQGADPTRRPALIVRYTQDGEGPADRDGDGFTADVDCNDADASINPDALEICNGLDDNCDGGVDVDAQGQALMAACYEGPDGTQGAGPCRGGMRMCLNGSFGVCQGQVLPAAERCDGADQDCDGATDEDFADLGDACVEGTGSCAAEGARICNEAGDGTTCDAEAGEPAPELCNGVDDNCDGQTDEGFNLGADCSEGAGQCAAAGTIICGQDGNPTCDAQPTQPRAELCNGLDDDCDGQIDNGLGLGSSCTVGRGACQARGVLICGQDGQVVCSAEADDGAIEQCNGVDDDCDGAIDEGANGQPLTATCYEGPEGTDGQGICRSGTAACINGSFGACVGQVLPAAEVCDGIDQNCDGRADETFANLGNACNEGVGQCAAAGVFVCNGNGDGTTCNAQPGQPVVETCNGLDDNCDGRADEGFNLGSACNEGVGQCAAAGTIVCSQDGNPICNAQPGEPVAETCNGLDDNCDGRADEGFNLGDACNEGVGQCAAAGTIVCGQDGNATCNAQPGQPVAERCNGLDDNCNGQADEDFDLGADCSAGVGQCAAAGSIICGQDGTPICDAQPGQPVAETCDGLDDDCDGQTDEGFALGDACVAGQGECQTNGVIACGDDGRAVCTAEAGEIGVERCNGLDDDCDGAIDEGANGQPLTATCYEGPEGTDGQGICRSGTATCTNGSFGACAGQILPAAEVCDGIDQNCDGRADETFANLGNACNEGVGQCAAAGVFVCNGNGNGTTCDAQPGQPVAEICNGLDDNCDGQADEGFNLGADCSEGVGQCAAAGRIVCGQDGSATCNAQPGQPRAETCNGLDDNCNGQADEGFDLGSACNEGVGQCAAAGVLVCGQDGNATCNAQLGQPVAELCNGLDDNCDGRADEGFDLGADCSAGVGQCAAAGSIICGQDGTPICDAQPGQPVAETCDGLDDDCDGQTDEGFALGDACVAGQGECRSNGVIACGDDGRAVCTAEAGEIGVERCNGLDDDCDGAIDEGANGQPLTATCYEGPEGTDGQGICRSGTAACINGSFGACVGQVLPAAEVCDGIDQNCDGRADETFANLGNACNEGVGQCAAAGVFVCNGNGDGTTCNAQPGQPVVETCNGLDDNCDGRADEGFNLGSACNEGIGQCAAAGTIVCDLDGGSTCNAQPGQPVAESCNGLDDNCDGQTDEGFNLGADCSEGVGQCAAAGRIVCGQDGSATCNAQPGQPAAELCNGLDDNCDGQADENFNLGSDCSVGVGACGAQGTVICGQDGNATCDAQAGQPGVETCNGIDDDCDGSVDEDANGQPLTATCYEGPEGTDGQGTCRSGTATCINGSFGACAGQVLPAAEICDGIDQNCDGRIDETFVNLGNACNEGVGQCAAAGVFVCNGNGDGTTCNAQPGQPVAETCNGLDDNCDGRADEGFNLGSACNEGVGQCAAAGTIVCDLDGSATCNAQPGQPRAETCNGLDDNCNGQADEGFNLGADCSEGVGQCAAAGRIVCGQDGSATCNAQPGQPAAELCNGLDDNCDGQTDEGFSLGADCSEGIGQCASAGIIVCTQDGNATCNAQPGQPAVETCDGVDDDCDGTIDEDANGQPLTVSCYEGPEGTDNTGVCRDGVRTCVAGDFGACNGAQGPSQEICNGEDDDCDGAIDEGADGAPLQRMCFSGPEGAAGQGLCRAGVSTCEQGVFGACDGEILPAQEICDGLDNDCDGDPDGGLNCACLPGESRACYSGPVGTAGNGVCQAGQQTCLNDGSGFTPCAGEVLPGAERCDSIDNDCNGIVDDNIPGVGAACEQGVGECLAEGSVACDGPNERIFCDTQPGQPAAEICNGLDDNCDGRADEGFNLGADCSVGVGACLERGALICGQNGAAVCSAQAGQPGVETCNGVDDDCDGSVDEDANGQPLTVACYEGPAGTDGQGICQGGQRTCADGGFGACVGQVLPAAEICDGIDQNCDGRTDETFANLGDACNEGIGQCTAAGVFVCNGNGDGTTCNAQPGQPDAETCNGLDDNCDGQTDEGFNLGSDCSVGVGACVAQGAVICGQDGNATCDATAGQPGVETCNGVDDDCDGSVDEDANGQPLTATCYEGPEGTDGQGICRSGTATCTNGSFGACAGQILPTAEVCDGIDQNCDGRADETFANLGDACNEGVGQCTAAGVFVCNGNGDGTTCNAQPGQPQAELCNGLDDNCDGQTDESFTNLGDACSEGIGQCAAVGTFICNGNGSGTTCNAQPGQPRAETCNGLDDNCDGQVDDGFNLGAECSEGIGQCAAAGTIICSQNGGATCDAQPGRPVAESCNGLDDNCDGRADENFNLGSDCSVGVGACGAQGTVICGQDGNATCDATAGQPGVETCNGIDDDCDGSVDEDANGQPLTATCYEGPEGTDGQGICRSGTATCTNGSFGACAGQVLPAAEICDGIDQNCDGRIDETFVNLGNACNEGVGQCAAAGVFVCNGNGNGTTCNAQPGQPVAETCNGLDDNCDGRADEGFNLGSACNEGVGQCAAAGTIVCDLDGGATCNAQPGQPRAETCNGLDDNCNGQADEGFNLGADCSEGVGQCAAAGRIVCGQDGSATCNAQPGQPVAEQCNGLDDNCNGQADEGFDLGSACNEGVGQCVAAGVFVCGQNGNATCNAQPGQPVAELCNGLDDNCDGRADEGFNLGSDCSVGVGACGAQGTVICGQDGNATCDATAGQPGIETCNGIDDDCDGSVDEDANGQPLTATCYEGPEGTDGQGICRSGTATCTNGSFGVCAGQILPAAEICDGIDQNCDGRADETFVNLGNACNEGVGQCAAAGVFVCNGNGDGTTCNAQPGQPVVETCNGLDDNCDGRADEGFNLGSACNEGVGQCAAAGTIVCDLDGGSTCNAQPGQPVAETCNGLDDNCDGRADEGFNLGSACNEGVGQCAASGTIVCGQDGNATCNAQPGQPVAEQCNGLDDNCDGQADEGFNLGADCSEGIGQCTASGTVICGQDGNATCDAQPGQPVAEQCNGLDDNCDGRADEGFNLGSDCNVGVGACGAQGTVICGQDGNATCDATAGQPGVETCNGIDDDCDGSVDEDANGQPLTATCYEGPEGTDGQGICRSGTATCTNGSFGVCAGQILPAAEICDGIDQNCDGRADETFVNLGNACNEGVGQCAAAGVFVCNGNGDGTTCNAQPGQPVAETCNGLDDNCDGAIDEEFGLGTACSEGVGQCAANGVLICNGEGGVQCGAQVGTPDVERCNGLDDDCDGIADETFDLGTACTEGIGACAAAGVFVCDQLGGVVCDANAGAPQGELCNGIDDDCDGQADESFANLGSACTEGIGACAASGTIVCDGAGQGTECNAIAQSPSSETCNGLDDDCDGQADEAFVELGSACTAGAGDCSADGVFVCDAVGQGVECSAQAGLGEAELCNGIDDDCDGLLDEDFPDLNLPCEDGLGQCASLGSTVCAQDGQGVVCEGITGGIEPTPEVCDNFDNDCDGNIDEGIPGLGEACNAGVGQCAAAGVQVCDLGTNELFCLTQAPPPQVETCDGLDNDCDGVTDEAFPTLGDDCTLGLGSCQDEGEVVCDPNGLGVLCNAQPDDPVAERCDGRDNDCDGVSDEDFDVGGDCSVGQGVCAQAGTIICSNRVAICDATAGQPGVETCNSLDDDCDGIADENFPDIGDPCGGGVGACAVEGVTVCDLDGQVVCSEKPLAPVPEACNGADDDCDGSTDEDFVADLGDNCSVGVGACVNQGQNVCDGTPDAQAMAFSGVQNDLVVAEVVAGGFDLCWNEPYEEAQTGIFGANEVTQLPGVLQRCEGEVLMMACRRLDAETLSVAAMGERDEILEVTPFATRVPNNIHNGVNWYFNNDFYWGFAPAGARIDAFSCDRVFDEQSGQRICWYTSNDTVRPGYRCGDEVVNASGLWERMIFQRSGTAQRGALGRLVCDADPLAPGEETCDGVDEDCDGSTDEGFPLNEFCTTGVGECAGVGRYVCDGQGGLACNAILGDPVAETCDNLDNDCDGLIDEGFNVSDSCSNGVGVCARNGQIRCAADGTAFCNAIPAAPDDAEICNGEDDDCDGATDEGVADCFIYASCSEALAAGNDRNGSFLIQPDPNLPAGLVFCDMTTDGGGWTLVASSAVNSNGRGGTIDDRGRAEWFSNLSTGFPNSSAPWVWSAMLAHGDRFDIRFACRTDRPGFPEPYDVDLSFYDNDWYAEIAGSTIDGETCFNTPDNPLELPARRNNLNGDFIEDNTPWEGQGQLVGEDSCQDGGDFAVDFNDGGRIGNRSDGTDWGEHNGSRTCGAINQGNGQWLIFVREVQQ
ncbi:MAG: MopE-related protein, partial [Bradymonadia bacterium]